MKKIYAFIIISLLSLRFVYGQTDWQKRNLKVPPSVCYASDKTEKIFIPPPAEIFLKSKTEKKSNIIVDYSLFPSDAKAAFDYAISIWEQIIESDVPIYVQANWRTIYDEKGNTNTILGQAGPSDYYENFEFAPHKNRFYPVAIAEKITNAEISGSSSPDIVSTFNKEIKWYFGTDGKTPDLLYDFVTVVLHEIGHGLGFTGFFFVTGQNGAYARDGGELGEASAFDFMVVNKDNNFLTDTTIFPIPSTNLYNAFTSNNLKMWSPVAIADNQGNKPKLYAPATWLNGSSLYHLDDATYPASGGNSLMTHAIGKGEAVHDPGPITRGILDDVGWKIMKLYLDKPKDIEQKKPLVFNLSIDSDFNIDSSSVYVYFTTDNFNNNIDSILFAPDFETGNLSARLNPDFETGEIKYFITAGDIKNRKFSSPSEAPSEFYTVTIGPDNQPPVIDHTPVPYFILNGNDINITVQADDNLGVDTVFVEYWINNIARQSFGLKHISGTTYSGIFNVNQNQLNDLDIFTYRITAVDSSRAKNTSVSPPGDPYSFRVEKIFNPVSSYISDFNSFSNDFIISDFNIYTPDGFQNGSLNSPHPYPSPDKNNSEFNFTTILKYPVILNKNGTMSYDEVVLVEPGETLSKFGDDNFWDYVIAEGSKDKGKTWLPLAPGYDSGDNSTWKTAYNKNIDNNQESTTVGDPSLYINREINLLANGNFKANDTILIRFRLFSDPFAHGWGWSIDNLRIQTPVSIGQAVLSPGNVMVYPNPFNDKLNIVIQAKKNISDLNIELVNVYGQKIIQQNEKNVTGEYRIEKDLNYLAKGIYIITVKENGNIVSSQKIIRR